MVADLTQESLSTAGWAVAVALLMLGDIFFIVRRKIFPLRDRGIWAVTLANVLCAVMLSDALMISVRLPTWKDKCVFHADIFAVCTLGIAMMYCVRSWRLLFRFKITDCISIIQQLRQQDSPDKEVYIQRRLQGFYIKHRYLCSNKVVLAALLLDIIICLAIVVPVSKQLPDNTKASTCARTKETTLFFTVMAILLLLHGAFCAVVGWKMRTFSSDGFRIKEELRAVGYSAMIIGVIYIAVSYGVPNLALPGYDLGTWLSGLMLIVFFFTSTVMPLSLSFRNKSGVETDSTMDLKTVLKYEEGRKSLFAFLATEFSTENLLFWQAVDELKQRIAKGITVEQARQKAKEIYNMHIPHDSQLQVNISAVQAKRVTEDMASVDSMNLESVSELFLEAQQEVFKLMEKDSWNRYKTTKFYADFLAEVKARRERDESITDRVDEAKRNARISVQVEEI